MSEERVRIIVRRRSIQIHNSEIPIYSRALSLFIKHVELVDNLYKCRVKIT